MCELSIKVPIQKSLETYRMHLVFCKTGSNKLTILHT